MKGTAGRRDRWAWGALVTLLALYVSCVLRTNPASTFGSTADDELYFSSAKALAGGQDYVLPGFPGTLKATKYPELYPLLLAGVWKLDPDFPGNVGLAIDLTVAFGCVALVMIFLLLRRWPGLSDWEALGVVALCGFTHYFLKLSGEIASEIPFTAALLAAVWLAERSEVRKRLAITAGIVAGLSVGLRSLGVAGIAGIGVVMLVKRDWRRLVWFSLGAAPIALIWLWPAIAAMFHPAASHTAAEITSSGWTQTVCYYSSYACNWRMNVSSAAGLWSIVRTNLKETVQEPGFYLLDPLAVRSTLWSLVLVMLVAVASYVGIVKYVRKAGWRSLPVIFGFYLLVILPWPYTPERFLVTFLPLFFGGLWLEGKHLMALVVSRLRQGNASGERVAASLLAAGGLAVAAIAAVNYARTTPSRLSERAAGYGKLLVDERGAYSWIRSHAAANAPVIAYEDGLLYLYTGRPSVVPIAWVTEGFYDGSERFAERDASHLADVARQIRASYWLVTTRDFDLTDADDHAALMARERQLLEMAPVAYRSQDGQVVLYDARELWLGRGVPRSRIVGFNSARGATFEPE